MSRSLCVSFTFFHFISYSFPRPGKVFWLDRFFGAGVVDKKAEKWYGWAVKHVDGGRRPSPCSFPESRALELQRCKPGRLRNGRTPPPECGAGLRTPEHRRMERVILRQ